MTNTNTALSPLATLATTRMTAMAMFVGGDQPPTTEGSGDMISWDINPSGHTVLNVGPNWEDGGFVPPAPTLTATLDRFGGLTVEVLVSAAVSATHWVTLTCALSTLGVPNTEVARCCRVASEAQVSEVHLAGVGRGALWAPSIREYAEGLAAFWMSEGRHEVAQGFTAFGEELGVL